ncbi:hypothetical protein HMPREF3160_01485 [Arthrobacter sp. HMSC06H05]|uniref:Phosphatidic acid phosphatase type 2/haloperoxidase domain-containing protein n=1 Tax=Pseudoglutamicibacter albus TaxID=98671 RepID=A0ABU1Z320_9MICC|nr:hypothetical protein [Pseudoglutamicibacter albus]MCG7304122.1 hypothetical protein [Pseudoglutamicibacter albus]MDR7294156.1 hypothetical protein [Pseudoglutamicibacter albus]OFT24321.1 hypothetical protein HMPREF3175_01130 [Arthrobacter sp. HMSC08H08]OFT43940.1 hypothetical protein HMPREF3160_01485 [Arthrobacter sp. HMSC06H05]
MPNLSTDTAHIRAVSQSRLWPRALATTVLSLGTLGLFSLTYWLFIKTVRGQWLDERALLGARRFVQETPALHNELGWFTYIPLAIAIGGVAVAIAQVFIRRSVIIPAIALTSAGFGIVCVRILKQTLLERPFTGVSEAYINSFPSGHSALAIGGMFAALLSMRARSRTWFSIIGALIAAAGGSVTFIMSWHRPADIVGSYLVVGFFAILAAGIIGWIDNDRPAVTFSAIACTVTGMGLAALTAAAMLLPEFVNVAQSRPLTTTADDAAAMASQLFTLLAVGLIVGTALALFGVIERLAMPARTAR